jgi:uncharacterized protein (TIGR01244 family)
MSRSARCLLLAAAIALLPAACATTRETAVETPAPVPAALPAATPSGVALLQPRPDLIVAGQPAADDWKALADAGVRTVINLRPAAEMQGRDERAEVAAAGLRYVELPIAGAADINADNARRLAELLGQADGPVLVHCASGNRVGGLLAVAKAQEGMAADEALEFGRSAGMKSSETRARAVIEEQRVALCAADTARAADPAQCPAGG